MKKVVIITTGGTIAMKKDKDGLAVPKVTAEDFLEALPELSTIAEVDALSWKNKPSSHLDFNDAVELTSILNEYEKIGFDAAVITQGTDTMEENSYLLDLLTNLNLGVTITGAQRNPSLPGSDGLANLLDAVVVATSARAAQEGVLVVFNGEAHAAREVMKTHTSRLDTFKSPEFGPLAAVTNMQAHWSRQNLIKEYYPVEKINKRVEIFKCALESDDYLLNLMLDHGVDGLVIESLGAGHVPPKVLPALKRAIDIGTPIILCSRCTGRLFTNTYGFLGAEKDMIEMGLIFGDALPGSKARIKLTLLLSAGYSLDEIREEFQKNYYPHL